MKFFEDSSKLENFKLKTLKVWGRSLKLRLLWCSKCWQSCWDECLPSSWATAISARQSRATSWRPSSWWTSITSSSSWGTSISSVLVFLGVNWIMMDWNGYNMRLDDDWVRNFDWDMDREGNSDFLDDWDFNFLVNWELLNMVMVNGVYVIRNFNLNVMAKKEKYI